MGLISRVSSRTYRFYFSTFRNVNIAYTSGEIKLKILPFLFYTKNPATPKMTVDQIKSIKTSNPDNIMAAAFDEEYFNTLSEDEQKQLLRCCNSGIQNPESCMGCYAMNPTDYDKYYNFFKPALEKYHKVNLSEKKHINDWNLKGVEGLPADGKLDVAAFGLGALSMRIRTARNLNKFPLPGAMTEQDRKDMEMAMKPVFDDLIANADFGGEYVSLTPGHPCHITDERYNQLVKEHIMFKNMADDSYLVTAGIAGDWPNGRGCYISADKGFIIWVGEEDHLRIMAMKKSTMIKEVFKPFGLGVRGLGGEHTPIGADGTVDISPKARFCISEAEIAIALYKGVEKVWAEEQAAKN